MHKWLELNTRWFLMLAAGCCFHTSGVALAQSYLFKELGTLGGNNSLALGINSLNQVVGSSNDPANIVNRPCLWTAGVISDIGTLGGDYGEAHAINSAGQIAGVTKTFFGFLHATRWDGSTKTDLGIIDNPPGTGATSRANDINASGKVVGSGQTSDYYMHATLWKAVDEMKDIDQGGAFPSSDAGAINSAGLIVGYRHTSTSSTSPRHASLWTPTLAGTYVRTDLGVLGSSTSASSYASDVNDLGVIVGRAQSSSSGSYRPVRWDIGAAAFDLGTLGGSSGQANAVNLEGKIVGSSQIAGDLASHATLWYQGQVADLNDRIDPVAQQAGWVLTAANDINEQGWIVGSATNSALGVSRAFLLEPTSETSGAFTELGYGVAGIAGIPQLAGAGNLTPNSPVLLDLAFTAPHTPALLLVSTTSIPTPFLGGTLIAVPFTATLTASADAQGRILLDTRWGASLPPGSELYFQYLMLDAAAPDLISQSTALRAQIP